jgi:uncharacterized protein (AIM24 family)
MQHRVLGTTMPVLELSLEAGEEVISTHGDLGWMSPSVTMHQTTGAGHGLMAALKRVAGGAGLLLTQYRAEGAPGLVAFAAKLPGQILEVTVDNNPYLVAGHGWLCATPQVVPSVGFQKHLGAGLFGGEGFVLERLEGSGTAWVELAGETVTYDLAPGQTLLAHPGHIGLFEARVSFEITRIKGIANRYFAGDGYFLAKLTGPGKIWLQSMPLPILAYALAPYLGGGNITVAPAAAVEAGMAAGAVESILGGH